MSYQVIPKLVDLGHLSRHVGEVLGYGDELVLGAGADRLVELLQVVHDTRRLLVPLLPHDTNTLATHTWHWIHK